MSLKYGGSEPLKKASMEGFRVASSGHAGPCQSCPCKVAPLRVQFPDGAFFFVCSGCAEFALDVYRLTILAV